MTDLIRRADAIEAVASITMSIHLSDVICDKLLALPSADITETEECQKCQETTERVLNRQGDEIKRLKASAEAVQGWIPCSERLPKAEDMYQPPEYRYLCQLEAYGMRKFCVLSRLKGAVSPFWDWYGVAFHDSEVTAWMPLPKPYEGGDSE